MKTIMKFESIEGWDKRANGTCLQGYINGSYHELVDAFGPPISGNDEYKTDAEWLLILNDTRTVRIISKRMDLMLKTLIVGMLAGRTLKYFFS
jgi:hypothetical protein